MRIRVSKLLACLGNVNFRQLECNSSNSGVQEKILKTHTHAFITYLYINMYTYTHIEALKKL